MDMFCTSDIPYRVIKLSCFPSLALINSIEKKTLFWEVLMEAQSGICFVKSKMPFSRVKNQCHSFDKHDDFDFQINS